MLMREDERIEEAASEKSSYAGRYTSEWRVHDRGIYKTRIVYALRGVVVEEKKKRGASSHEKTLQERICLYRWSWTERQKGFKENLITRWQTKLGLFVSHFLYFR